MSYARQAAALGRHLAITPFLAELERAAPDAVDTPTWGAVIDQAARIAEALIDPLDATLDRIGARIEDGRVVTVPGHREAWRRFTADGWLTLALEEGAGGQGLPLALLTACEELFNRASPAFTMLATPNRAAAALLHDVADAPVRDTWVPRLAAGEWAATICISEPEAGSDVARIRTRAAMGGDGTWRITGQKCWISYGDHDLATRIGHCMLARSSDAPGARGLGLFLVPDRRDDGTPNGIRVGRLEEKLGLHGSPTCVLDFQDAEAIPIGQEGRGLQTLFPMMLGMRLACAPQGIGVATAALETAIAYAGERRQGGNAALPAVAIVDHADVQRQVLDMAGRVEAARGVALMAATVMDLGARAPAAERERWLTLAQFLLPIAKDRSARLAFEIASDALQVLGGAGYTREWPIERRLRDARVFAVFEGTSGIQALDLLHRRLWRDRGAGLHLFLAAARADLGDDRDAATIARLLDRLEAVAATLTGWETSALDAEAGANAFLDLCGLAAEGWIALRLIRHGGDNPVGRRLGAAARFHLAGIEARAEAAALLATLGAARLGGIGDYLA